MIIQRGGTSEERLYLYNYSFSLGDDIVNIYKTDMRDLENTIARHKSRYFLPAMFCRPGMTVLDFPCGSGYGYEIFKQMGVEYYGEDIDPITVEYCNRMYGEYFSYGDLCDPAEPRGMYDVIACIEGIEHIEREYQANTVSVFHSALRNGGILVVTTPEKGQTTTHPYHKGEMTYKEFSDLLHDSFQDVQILHHMDTLHNGIQSNLLYGICKKEAV